MSHILLNIKEDKVQEFLKIIKKLDFVSIESTISKVEVDAIETIKNGLKEFNSIKQGKTKALTEEEFFNEL